MTFFPKIFSAYSSLSVLITFPFPKVERTDSLELIPAMANSRKPSTPGTMTGATTLTTTSLLSASQASFRYCIARGHIIRLEHVALLK